MSKLTPVNSLWAKEVADLFGICGNTFRKRWQDGYYKIRRKDFVNGWKYDIYDVFRVLYPRANAKELDAYIAQYRNTKRRFKSKG